MGVQKQGKHKIYICKTYRNSWWKFWKIDHLEFELLTRYDNAYKEVIRKTINGKTYSMELNSWVVEDVREKLLVRIKTYSKLVKKAKKLSVKFSTRESGQYYTDSMDFYIRGEGIYFDSDNAIKRDNILNQLGIK